MTTDIPAITEEPFVYVEFDSSNATTGPTIKTYKALVIGQRLAAGSVAELIPTRVRSAEEAAGFFGLGSMLHAMAKAWFANNRSTETWFVAQDDHVSAVDATQTLTVVGTTTAAGTLFLYIDGELLQVSLASGDDQDAIAAAIAAAITADLDSPFTASATLAVVTVTAKNGGEQGISIDVRFNLNPDEFFVAGITSITVAAGVAGSNDPTITPVFAVLGDVQYDVFAIGYDASLNLDLIDTELSDRWGPIRAIEGVAIVGTSDTLANLITKGNGENGRFTCIVGAQNAPSSPWRWAAAAAANVARSGSADPARPYRSLELKGIVPPVAADLFDLLERESLIAEGMATWTVDASGRARASRLVSTYKTTALGTPDKAFQDLTTALTLGFMRFDLRSVILKKYPRHKLAGDDNEFGAGQAVVTPSTMKAEVVAVARGWVTLGLMENIEQFIADTTVERDLQNVARLNIFLPPDLVNGFLVTAATVGFRL